MHKFRFYIDFDKEEKWLEQMASEGYHLQNTFFGYQFRQGEPEASTIKIDFRKFKTREDFVDYCTMFEDSGWKHLVGTKNSGIQYFKRIDESAGADIFSDTHSKASRYKRYADMSFELAISFVPLFVIFYLSDVLNFDGFINPKGLYYTPGLWDKTGSSFWFSFLFETPFALARGFAWMLIPLNIILYLLFGYTSKKLYLQHSK